MRPQQQNRRMRGRNNNNNRKGPNPLTRNYESNGPDVKIRGSAHQIAEKYATLARDAMSSGDRVMAENYLQHAEHYNRIIMASQAQMPQQFRDFREEQDEDGEDERDEFDMPIAQPSQQQPQAGQQQPRPQQQFGQQQPRQNETQPVQDGSGPQPVIEGVPAEVALEQEAFNGAGATNGEERDRREGSRENRANGVPYTEGDQPRRPRRPRRGPRREEGGSPVNGSSFGQNDGEDGAAPASEAGSGEPVLASNE